MMIPRAIFILIAVLVLAVTAVYSQFLLIPHAPSVKLPNAMIRAYQTTFPKPNISPKPNTIKPRSQITLPLTRVPIQPVSVGPKNSPILPVPKKKAESSTKQKAKTNSKDPCDLCWEAKRQYDLGHWEPARKLYLKYIAKLEESEGPNGLDIPPMLQNVGYCYEHQKRYQEAQASFKKAISIYIARGKENSTKMADVLNDLATSYYRSGQYVQAEPICKQVLTILNNAGEPSQEEIVIVRNNYAKLLKALGRNAEAQDIAIGEQ